MSTVSSVPSFSTLSLADFDVKHAALRMQVQKFAQQPCTKCLDWDLPSYMQGYDIESILNTSANPNVIPKSLNLLDDQGNLLMQNFQVVVNPMPKCDPWTVQLAHHSTTQITITVQNAA